MKKNLKKEINDFFSRKPDAEQKAWGIINMFYHMVLTKMEKENMSRADLAKKLNVSRASVSQMFNKTPNLSIKKMVEIAESVNLELSITEKVMAVEEEYITSSRPWCETPMFEKIAPNKTINIENFPTLVIANAWASAKLGECH